MSTDPTPTSRAAEVLAEHGPSGSVNSREGWVECLCGDRLYLPSGLTFDGYAEMVEEEETARRDHAVQALADAGLLREQEPAQGGLTEEWWRQRLTAFAAHDGTAAAGDEGLQRGVQKVLLDWPHDDTCPAFTRSGACECWHSELRDLLDATPAPTEAPAPSQDTLRAAVDVEYAIHEAVCTAYTHEGRNALCHRAAKAALAALAATTPEATGRDGGLA